MAPEFLDWELVLECLDLESGFLDSELVLGCLDLGQVQCPEPWPLQKLPNTEQGALGPSEALGALEYPGVSGE